MPSPKIRWEPYGSMHFGYLGEAESLDFSYIIQGPDRGMYALYKYISAYLSRYPSHIGDRIEEFPDLETAKLAAEKIEGSRC